MGARLRLKDINPAQIFIGDSPGYGCDLLDERKLDRKPTSPVNSFFAYGGSLIAGSMPAGGYLC